MAKDLHYLILKFFRERMTEHGRVNHYTEIQDDRDFLFTIERNAPLPALTVHLSDAYRYTMHDYYSKPSLLKPGDFILIAKPEADFDTSIVAIAAKDKIGIGKMRKFLGALHRKNIWTYQEPE